MWGGIVQGFLFILATENHGKSRTVTEMAILANHGKSRKQLETVWEITEMVGVNHGKSLQVLVTTEQPSGYGAKTETKTRMETKN